MHRFSPKSHTTDYPDYIEGTCYTILREDLFFGSNKKEDNIARPCLSLRKRDSFLIVLPMTTIKNKRFYHLLPGDCLPTKKQNKINDSYVSSDYEVLSFEASKRSKKIGILSHPKRIKIADWLKSKI